MYTPYVIHGDGGSYNIDKTVNVYIAKWEHNSLQIQINKGIQNDPFHSMISNDLIIFINYNLLSNLNWSHW